MIELILIQSKLQKHAGGGRTQYGRRSLSLLESEERGEMLANLLAT